MNWSWEGLDGSESSEATRWGVYTVQGTFDGESLTLTQRPVPPAEHGSMAHSAPTDGKAGTTDEETWLEIQEELADLLGDNYVTTGLRDGQVSVNVVWDDGTVQEAADADYGEGVVIIEPALRPVG